MADQDPMAELPKMDPVTPTPPPQAPQNRPSTRLTIVSLALGVLAVSVFPLGVALGPLAIIFGKISQRRMGSRGGTAVTAQALGMVGLFLGLAFLTMLPCMLRARELAKRVACSTNLKAIGRGFMIYTPGGCCGDPHPWISNVKGMRYDAPMRAAPTINELDGNPSGPGVDCNMLQNLCIFVQTGLVSWKTFRCPNVGTEIMPRDSSTMWGFQWDESKKTNYIDYAYHIGYFDTVDGINAAPLTDAMDGGMAIMADKAPSPDAAFNDFYPTQANSPNRGDGWNHGSEGVQVLTAGGSVFWSEKTIKGGLSKNNIYQRDMEAGKIVAPQGMKTPVYKNDSVLFWSQGK